MKLENILENIKAILGAMFFYFIIAPLILLVGIINFVKTPWNLKAK